MNDGIPETYVNWISQDSRGFIWVATWHGLLKFDGYKFTNYKRNPASANSLGHNIVTGLWEDHYGRLWVGHDAGLDLFNPQTEEFHHFPRPDPDSKWKVNKVRVRKDGKLWICANNGIYIADIETLSMERMTGLADDAYWDIAETRNGSVWAAGDHSVTHIDGETGGTSIYKHDLDDPDGLFPGSTGFPIYVDEQEKVWVGGSGLNLFDEDSKSFIHYLTGHRVRHVLGNSDGKLLIGYNLGVLLFDPKTGMHEKIAGEFPTSVLKDMQGIIWYSSPSGLYQINPKTGKFRRKQQFSWIGGIVEDGGRDIWIFSSSGVFRFDPSLRKVLEHRRRTISAISVDGEGSIWFISFDKLEKYDFRSKTISEQTLSDSNRKRGIATYSFIDSFGDIWTGGWAGVGKYNSKTNRIEALESFPDAYVISFLEDPYKNLWIGSSAGLWRYNLISHKLDVFENDPADRQSLSDNRVHHMIMDRNQNIWIGTGTGLNKMIKGTENDEPRFASWKAGTSGLPIDFVTCIVDGADGTLWLACGNMISHFDPGKNTFRNYYYTDFISSTRFNHAFTWGKGLRTSEGKVILGTISDGLVIFHPDSLVDNSYVPPVVITDFLINNEQVPIEKTAADTLAWETPLKKGISYTNEIALTYLQNDFAFEFSALNYVNPERNRYKYRLEPYESVWTETNANNRIARYTNIDPGTYTFHVIGSNNDGVWNEEGTRLTILITPPWWQTWWAYSFYGVTLIGIF
ncbi:MAG: two-component regulator propeller domain-containing protein, partial [Cyclobacteriaceae bacterium]